VARDILVSAFLLSGSFFILLSAIGILRMPDLYMRVSTATKATTLGVGLIVLGAAVHFGSLPIVGKSLLVIAFLFLTAPVAGQILARAGLLTGSPLWEGTRYNDYEEDAAGQKKEGSNPGRGNHERASKT
jgi:multicomponent Na+:H+ antiporter subunit G